MRGDVSLPFHQQSQEPLRGRLPVGPQTDCGGKDDMKKKMTAWLLTAALGSALLTGCGAAQEASPESGAAKTAAQAEATTQAAETAQSEAPQGESAEEAQEEPVHLGKVVCGIHQGGSANCAAFLAKQLGYDEKYGFDLELVVTTGPNVYASVVGGEMNTGFLGNGMAWHYFEPEAKLSMLTLDNLTDDDKLLLRSSFDFAGDGADTLDDLYEKLPGLSIALDLTTSPGVFWKNLITAVNEGREQPLWYEDVEGAYPQKGDEAHKINIVNTANANITAAMEDSSIDGAVCFGSVRKGLQAGDGYKTVASAKWHLANTLTPSQYCVNTAWAQENPELLQAFMNALMDAFEYRADESNWDKCIEMAMAFDQLEAKDYDMTIGYWPTKADLREWFADENGVGYTYLENIRNSHIGSNGLTDENMKPVQEVLLTEYLLKACEP